MGGGGEETKRRLKGKWEVGGGGRSFAWVAPNSQTRRGSGGWGGRGRQREKVEGELIDKNLSSISMGNLLGREGRRCEKKEKKKEEKRRRGETRKNPKQLSHTHKTLVHEKRILNNIPLQFFTTHKTLVLFFEKNS